MANVTATNGESFHLWGLHADSSKEVSPSIEFNEIRNDLGNGFRTQVLYGADTGTRSWTISLPTLAGNDMPVPAVTGVNGETVSREQYIWDLYCETRITGKPFVYTCPREGQYYLVDFVNSKLTYEKEFRNALYSTGVEIRQVREAGVSVFDPARFGLYGSPGGIAASLKETGHSNPNWIDGVSGLTGFGANGTVTFAANPQNGHNTVRLDGSTGRLDGGTGTAFDSNSYGDIFIAMQMQEATFSGNDVLLSNPGSSNIISGTSGGTKWQNPSLTGFEYRLNGDLYASSDMQAPMNEWGVCHFRATVANPMNFSNYVRLGASSSATLFLTADIGEVFATPDPVSMADARSITEYLVIKWL